MWPVMGAVLAVVVLAAGSSPGGVSAEAVKNGGAVCWTTGQLGEHEDDDQSGGQGNNGYGGDEEFVLDVQDFWRAVPLTDQSLKELDGNYALTAKDGRDFGYFSSFAQAIDFTFAMSRRDMQRFPLDTPGSDLQRLVAPEDGVGSDRPNPAGGRLRIPWENQRSYAHRRAVASNEHRWRVQSFEAMWVDPFHPDGGIGVDWQRFASDLLGGQTDIAAVTHTGVQAGSGNRQIVGQGSMPVMTMGGTRSVNCSGTNCTFEDNVVSGVAQAQVSQVATDSDHGEVMDPSIGTGVRGVQMPWGGDPVTSTVGAVSGDMIKYQGVSGTYGSLFQEDTEEDKLYVNIILDPEARSDYEYRVVDRDGFGQFYLRNFGQGDGLWTVDDFGGESPLWAQGRFAGGYQRVPTGTQVLRVPTGTQAIMGDVYDNHRGYRQPTLGTAYLPFKGNYPSGSFKAFEGLGGENRPNDHSDCDSSSDYDCHYEDALVHETRKPGSGPADYADGADGGDWDKIRWPVNIEDMNWYLYQLPADPSSGGNEWLAYFLSETGANWTMGSGYGWQPRGATVGDPHDLKTPNCWWVDADEDDAIPAVPTAGNILCQNKDESEDGNITDPFAVDDPRWDDLTGGKEEYVLFPFETGNTSTASSQIGTLDWFSGDPSRANRRNFPYPIELMRAGVARAEDADGALPRSLNRFAFVVDEGVRVGETNLDRSGVDANRRYGAPIDEEWRRAYFTNWPNGPLNPNIPHMMVLTFYESLRNGGGEKSFGLADSSVTFNMGATTTEITGRDIRLPERHIRRVICRAMVYPAGFHPISDDGGNFLMRALSRATSWVNDAIDSVKAWAQRWVVAIAKWPGNGAKKVMEWSCEGIMVADKAMNRSDGAELAGGVARFGANYATLGGYQGVSDVARSACAQFTVPAEPTCQDSTADVIVEGACIDLPEMVLSVNADRSSYFMPPQGSGGNQPQGVGFGSLVDGVDGPASIQRFYPVFDPVQTGPSANRLPNPFNVGLAKLRLDFDFAWDSVDTGLYNGVSGYSVMVRPDPRAYAYLTNASKDAYFTDQDLKFVEFEFLLPRQVLEHRGRHITQRLANFDGVVLDDRPFTATESVYHEIGGFWVGALSGEGGDRSPLVEPYKSVPGEYTVRYEPLAVSGVRGDFVRFNRVVSSLPLGPGYAHSFSVAPYVGRPGSPDFQVANQGQVVTISGSEAICIALGRDDRDVIPSGSDLSDEQLGAVMEYLDCPNRSSLAQPAPFTEEDYEIGLLGLASSEVCGDIFTATPPRFTWDNPVVRTGWTLMWVVAGSVLFLLLVWQSFRMTFDLWLMPAPAVGFRELLPRFLAAVVLAAASLFLAKWILILCTDLTCFVAHMTGTNMWSMVGDIFVNVSESLILLVGNDPVQTVVNPMRFVVRVVLANLIVLILLIAFVWLFLKVFFQMVLRIALLAMLIVFGPLAGAFYASESTSHWTKMWFSMFMGTAFQQVAVLMVIYVGVHLIGYAGDEEADSVFGFILSMMLALLVLVAADRIVNIVNPSWRAGSGMFAGFGQVLGMGMQAAVLIASAGAGAAMGAAGAARGGGGVASVSGRKSDGGDGTASLGGQTGDGGGGDDGGGDGGTTGAMQNLPSSDKGAEGSGGGVGGRGESGGGSGRGAGMMSGAVQGMRWGGRFNRFAVGLSRGQVNAEPLLPREERRGRREFDQAIHAQTRDNVPDNDVVDRHDDDEGHDDDGE